MNRDEALLIKQWDSAGELARLVPVANQIETLAVPARLASTAPTSTQRHLKMHLIVGVSRFAASLSTTNCDLWNRSWVED